MTDKPTVPPSPPSKDGPSASLSVTREPHDEKAKPDPEPRDETHDSIDPATGALINPAEHAAFHAKERETSKKS